MTMKKGLLIGNLKENVFCMQGKNFKVNFSIMLIQAGIFLFPVMVLTNGTIKQNPATNIVV